MVTFNSCTKPRGGSGRGGGISGKGNDSRSSSGYGGSSGGDGGSSGCGGSSGYGGSSCGEGSAHGGCGICYLYLFIFRLTNNIIFCYLVFGCNSVY